jgi:hypothetical protein
LAHLAFVEWRRVDRHEHFGAEFDQFICWIVGVESLAPERVVVPEEFAECDADVGVSVVG